jgi:hypothetical protein
MNRKESKKIAVMAALIMGFMVIAFVPMASATVTDFTVTPSTGIAGAVDSYNVLVNTDGVTSINIAIPAGFIAVTPTTGGVLIARVDFWNSRTKAYYGHATITSNNADPTGQVDIYCEFGADKITTTQDVDYTAGETNTFESGFPSDTSSAIIKLPTNTLPGSIKICINSTAFKLDDVMIAIKQFVKNPGAGDYDFIADGVTETVTITAPLAYPTVYKDGLWFVDSDGDLIADICFLYGSAGANIKPLVGDLYGRADIITYGSVTGLWQVDTNHDRVTDHSFIYGGSGSKALVGDVNQDGKDDIAVVTGSAWYVDTTGNQIPDLIFLYGGPGSTPLIGDVNQDGKDDIAVVTGSAWYVDTTYVPGDTLPLADLMFLYGGPGSRPLIGDADQDGKDDVVVFTNGWWFADTNNSHTANLQFLYGTTGMIPLVGAIR